MSLEKILVGDDKIDFAKSVFPTIPNAQVEFVNNPNCEMLQEIGHSIDEIKLL